MTLSSLPPTLPEVGEESPLEPAAPDLNITTQQPKHKPAKSLELGAMAVFGSTFLTIFLSEMGDKTQLATLLMTAQSQSPWIVFAGASSALIATSLLGCLLGRWLATRISPQVLNKAAAGSMLLIAVQLLWEIAPR